MKKLVLALSLVGLAALPFWVANDYYVNIATQILLYAVFALGLNLLVAMRASSRSAMRDSSASPPMPGRSLSMAVPVTSSASSARWW